MDSAIKHSITPSCPIDGSIEEVQLISSSELNDDQFMNPMIDHCDDCDDEIILMIATIDDCDDEIIRQYCGKRLF